MPRRDDGTAMRYEFQVFDTPKGRVVADLLEEIKAEGGSVAAFIREALYVYIQSQAGSQNGTSLETIGHHTEAPLTMPPSAVFKPVDDTDDEIELEVRAVSGGTSAQNFLTSVLGLQQ